MAINDYDPQINSAAAQYGIDPRLLKSMMSVESNGNPNAAGPIIKSGPAAGTRAQGLMQFIPQTAAQYGVDPLNPDSAIPGAAHYLSDLLHQHGDVDVALDHYSGGASGYGQKIANAYRAVQPLTPSRAEATPPSPSVPTVTELPPEEAALFAAPKVAPSPTPAIAPTAPSAPSAPPQLPPDEAALFAAPKPTPTAAPPSAPAAPESWLQHNITGPLASIQDPRLAAPTPSYNPLTQPLLRTPVAGMAQGVRDVGTTIGNFDQWLAAKSPAYAALDRSFGYTPGSSSATDAAETAAFEKQYGDSWTATAGRLGGNLLATAPIGLPAHAVGAAAGALPVIGRVAAPLAEWGTTGAGANVLTSGGATPEDWAREAETGAAGGAALRGALGTVGRVALGPATTAASAIADRLGIDLSQGQIGGGFGKRIEDVTGIMPFSGAAKFSENQRSQIAQVIAREAGIPGPVAQITTPMLKQAESDIGDRLENAAQNITVPGEPVIPALASIENQAAQAGPNSEQAQTFKNISNQLVSLISNNGNELPGPELAKFIARGGPIDTALQSSNGEVQKVGGKIRDALFDAAGQSSGTSADALNALNQARYQWKVLKTVQPAINKTVTGSEEMSLPALKTAINREFDMTQPSGPGANMQDLSRLIGGPLSTLPSSGTAERLFMQRLFTGELGTAGTAAVGSLAAGLPHVAGALGAFAGIPAAAGLIGGRALRYGPGLGIAPLEWTQRTFNPLLPRLGASAAGNWLMNQNQRPPP